MKSVYEKRKALDKNESSNPKKITFENVTTALVKFKGNARAQTSKNPGEKSSNTAFQQWKSN